MPRFAWESSRGRPDFLARAYRAERFQSQPLTAAIALVAELTADSQAVSRPRQCKNSVLSSSAQRHRNPECKRSRDLAFLFTPFYFSEPYVDRLSSRRCVCTSRHTLRNQIVDRAQKHAQIFPNIRHIQIRGWARWCTINGVDVQVDWTNVDWRFSLSLLECNLCTLLRYYWIVKSPSYLIRGYRNSRYSCMRINYIVLINYINFF